MIAAMVVPFGCRNIPRTVSCLDEALVSLTAAFLSAAALDAAVDRTALRFPLENGGVRDCLVVRFAAFDLVLVVAIWLPPPCQRQHQALPLTRAPQSGGASRS